MREEVGPRVQDMTLQFCVRDPVQSYSLGDATSFRNQARDIGTRGKKAAFGQWLNM